MALMSLRYASALVLLAPLWAAGPRVTVSLDGAWDIADSVSASEIPRVFTSRAPVPGLANLARPAFAGVDQFDSRELIDNRIRKKQLPESARVATVGVPRQDRNYFWYRTRFRPPARNETAILKVNKAQFGTAVWLNGRAAGEHAGCFTAGFFDLSKLIRWDGDNELLIRIGAHPAAMPASVPAGTDFEKLKWTPGIYDSVSLALSGNPTIETIQVAPRVASSSILVEIRLRNRGATAVSFTLTHGVRTWKDGRAVAQGRPQRLSLQAGEEKTVVETISMPGARLWTPDDPFLYLLESSTGGDSVTTRFGMREFRFDTPTRRAFLNDRMIFLRGSNITLHRFLEDPRAGALAWDEKWVRKLLADIPKRMHWNAFRFCIGPVPDKWLEIADEAGLLIQYEYFIWTGPNQWHKEWETRELIRELSEWQRDNWNHPSVAIWDACNETTADVLGREVIPAVRKLDLSNRPWDNGYNLPAGADDMYEDHPYLFGRIVPGSTPPFRITDLERMEHFKQPGAPHPTAHASILNEYGWLWLNRDGSPTLLTKDVWDAILGPNASGEERLKEWAYLLGGLTEFWRSRRFHAGVLHFVYLTCSFPGVFTSDHWRDVEKLELNRDFEDHVGEAFRPLGVYLNFWQPSLKQGAERRVAVAMINDGHEPAGGKLVLSLESSSGDLLTREQTAFSIPPLGQHTYEFPLRVPRTKGAALLTAIAFPDGARAGQPTVSRRKTSIVE